MSNSTQDASVPLSGSRTPLTTCQLTWKRLSVSGTPPTTTTSITYAMTTYMAEPLFPEYSSQEWRQQSYSQCKEVHHPPRQLAQAGFFFDGAGNCSQCFHCGISITISYNVYNICVCVCALACLYNVCLFLCFLAPFLTV